MKKHRQAEFQIITFKHCFTRKLFINEICFLTTRCNFNSVLRHPVLANSLRESRNPRILKDVPHLGPIIVAMPQESLVLFVLVSHAYLTRDRQFAQPTSTLVLRMNVLLQLIKLMNSHQGRLDISKVRRKRRSSSPLPPSRDVPMGGMGDVTPPNIVKCARKLVKVQSCCRRVGHSIFRDLSFSNNGWSIGQTLPPKKSVSVYH